MTRLLRAAAWFVGALALAVAGVCFGLLVLEWVARLVVSY